MKHGMSDEERNFIAEVLNTRELASSGNYEAKNGVINCGQYPESDAGVFRVLCARIAHLRERLANLEMALELMKWHGYAGVAKRNANKEV